MTNPPELRQLDSLTEIARAFKVGAKRVKKWCRMTPPPPIAVEGEGTNKRYSAEYYALQAWRIEAFAPKT
jgi:hypothetical protein